MFYPNKLAVENFCLTAGKETIIKASKTSLIRLKTFLKKYHEK